MTDSQLLTLALAIIIPLSMLIYSNSRISDTKDSMKASLTETKETLRAEMGTLRADILAAIKGLETKLEIHELEHHRK